MEQLEKTKRWIKNSITLKLGVISVLALLMLVPANMIKNLILERERTKNQVMREISGKWGGEQSIAGPVLTMPYKTTVIVNDKAREVVEHAHFLPDKLDIMGEITPEIRYRGIYKVIAYKTLLDFKGEFEKLDLGKLKIPIENVLWDDAFVTIGIPDMNGINAPIRINWNQQHAYCEPGIDVKDVMASGVSCKIAANQDSINTFSFQLDLNGSEAVYFYPLGKTTNVKLSSTWDSPSFHGTFLPDERIISEEGFSAYWNVLHLNRNYPQQWKGEAYEIDNSDFGVKLISPVDQYQKSMRSVKYAIMFVALTFIIFFFIEVFTKNKVHPVQYLLVGIALCVFYSLLISLAEHIGFNWAYLIASLSIITLITAYSLGVFKNKWHSGIMGLVLSMLYLFMFTILQLADYALLLGNIGLLAVLAAIMFYSKKIDWYRNADGDET